MRQKTLAAAEVLETYYRYKEAADALDPEGEPIPRKREELDRQKGDLKAISRTLWGVAEELRTVEQRMSKFRALDAVISGAIAGLTERADVATEALNARAEAEGVSTDHPRVTLERYKAEELNAALAAAIGGWHDSSLIRPVEPPEQLRRALVIPPGIDHRELLPRNVTMQILKELSERRSRAIAKAQPYLDSRSESHRRASKSSAA